jgi:hypothetical protein
MSKPIMTSISEGAKRTHRLIDGGIGPDHINIIKGRERRGAR